MARPSRVLVIVSAAIIGVLGTAAPSSAAGPVTVPLTPTGNILVSYRGNGHGHGMSQYGAYGAALAGRSYQQILSFYYPGTRLTKIGPTAVRVLLSGAGTTTTIAATPGVTLYGVPGALPVAGIARYRLIANSGYGLTLQKLPTRSATWVTVRTHVPNGAWFHGVGPAGLQLFAPDGSSTYYGYYLKVYRASPVGAAGGVYTVNYTGIELYTAGVTPREMPSSWSPAAVDAQAVAARSYVAYALAHPMAKNYDICDSTMCQVFGGTRHLNSAGAVAWNNFPRAASDTDHLVLTYGGAPVFAQFSASDGGWTTAGGQPYLPAQSDPYDPGKSGDPYIDATTTVKVSTLAKSVGLTTVTGLTITSRDGHGEWGGRVLSAVVAGTKGTQKATQNVTGYDLQSAFGLGTTWLNVAAAS